MVKFNSEGLKNMMLQILAQAVLDYKRNKRAIRRNKLKLEASTDLEESITLMESIKLLEGENKAIERYVINPNSNCYVYTDLEPTYFIKKFKEEFNIND